MRFVFDDRKLKRTAMDYVEHVDCVRHRSWDEFRNQLAGRRLVLLTTKAAMSYHQFLFQSDDVVMVGRESAGVPEDVHQAADARLTIPMKAAARSLNVGMAAAIVLSEALRQFENASK